MKLKTGGRERNLRRKEGRREGNSVNRIERSRGAVRSLRIRTSPSHSFCKQASSADGACLVFSLSRIKSLQRFTTTGMRRRDAIRNLLPVLVPNCLKATFEFLSSLGSTGFWAHLVQSPATKQMSQFFGELIFVLGVLENLFLRWLRCSAAAAPGSRDRCCFWKNLACHPSNGGTRLFTVRSTYPHV